MWGVAVAAAAQESINSLTAKKAALTEAVAAKEATAARNKARKKDKEAMISQLTKVAAVLALP